MPFKALALFGAIFFPALFSAAIVLLTDSSRVTSVLRNSGGMWPEAGMGEETTEIWCRAMNRSNLSSSRMSTAQYD